MLTSSNQQYRSAVATQTLTTADTQFIVTCHMTFLVNLYWDNKDSDSDSCHISLFAVRNRHTLLLRVRRPPSNKQKTALLQSHIKWYNEKKSSLDLDLLAGYVDLSHALA